MSEGRCKQMAELCLGTVQLGQKYGINNQIGRQPTHEEAFGIIQAAIDSGIEYIDTASVYGEAEELLGKFGIGNYPVKVITKLYIRDSADINNIKKLVHSSLQKLKMDCVDGYLLHNAADMYNDAIMQQMTEVKESGMVNHIGVSIYEPEDAVYAAKLKEIDYIQIPYNVFDQRLDHTEFFHLTKENGKTVFARSAFLQGLLLSDEKTIPLPEAADSIKLFRAIIKKYHISPQQAAFYFSYTHSNIDYVVFGVDTKEQLLNNLAMVNDLNDDFMKCRQELASSFKDMPREIITPSLWRKD